MNTLNGKKKLNNSINAFFKFIIVVWGGHCDYSHWEPKDLATPLLTICVTWRGYATTDKMRDDVATPLLTRYVTWRGYATTNKMRDLTWLRHCWQYAWHDVATPLLTRHVTWRSYATADKIRDMKL
jgi:hypothetical protein